MTKNICIFGFLDSEAGQLYNLLNNKIQKKIKYFVCIDKLPKINIRNEQKKRPNKKTSFCVNGKLFGITVLQFPDYEKIIKKDKIKECFIAESNIKKRIKIYKFAKKNRIKVNSFVHPSVLFGKKSSSSIGEGSIIFPKNYIGYKTDIGRCCIIQSNCNIEHHNKIEDFCNLNPGIFTGGFTKIEEQTEVHIHSTIINRITIGKKSRVGAGSLVIKNVSPKSLVFGRPAKAKN